MHKQRRAKQGQTKGQCCWCCKKREGQSRGYNDIGVGAMIGIWVRAKGEVRAKVCCVYCLCAAYYTETLKFQKKFKVCGLPLTVAIGRDSCHVHDVRCDGWSHGVIR
jgi:hypothetical protein